MNCFKLMRSAARLLRCVDTWLLTRTIPIESFRWETTGFFYPDLGHPVPMGRWHFSQIEVQRFFDHNARITRFSALLRGIAVKLEQRNCALDRSDAR